MDGQAFEETEKLYDEAVLTSVVEESSRIWDYLLDYPENAIHCI